MDLERAYERMGDWLRVRVEEAERAGFEPGEEIYVLRPAPEKSPKPKFVEPFA